jgi:tRNA(adenine34) deaminase
MTDEYFMMQALVVMNEKIIARGHNMTERLNDPTAHAEMIALTSAFNLLGSKYLPDATLYITLEPCFMCAGAIYWSKVGKIVYGADDEKNGYKKTAGSNWPFHPKAELIKGVLKDDCAQLMKDFFKDKR